MPHVTLDTHAPISRAVQAIEIIVATPLVGGLHHQYLPDLLSSRDRRSKGSRSGLSEYVPGSANLTDRQGRDATIQLGEQIGTIGQMRGFGIEDMQEAALFQRQEIGVSQQS